MPTATCTIAIRSQHRASMMLFDLSVVSVLSSLSVRCVYTPCGDKDAGAVDSVRRRAALRANPLQRAVLLKMPAGCHTYWMHSRFPARPQTFDWQLPDGIKTGEIQWPVPEKLTVADLTTTLSRRILLRVPLTLAETWAAATKEIKARVS